MRLMRFPRKISRSQDVSRNMNAFWLLKKGEKKYELESIVINN